MLRDTIRKFAATQPARPAIHSIGKNPLSYAELDQQIEAIGTELRRGALAADARIGIALLDGPEAIIAILAVASHATAVPINNSHSPDEVRQLLEQANIQAVIVTQTTPAHIRRVASGLGLAIIDAVVGKGTEIACVLAVPNTKAAAAAAPSETSIALILQTSGTTGVPKLLPITHRNLLSEAAKMRDWFKLSPDDCCLSSLPLCYAHGLREILFPPILTGGSIARPANYTQLDIIPWLEQLKPTWYSTFPIFHRSIFELLSANDGARPRHNLRFVLSAGTPLNAELREGLERLLKVPVLEFYGIGEAGHMTANLPQPGKHKPGTCGVPLPGEMMIAHDGKPVPWGELGEVLVRGPTLVSGYLNSPQASKDAFVDGWYKTGDLGTFDADGFLSIHGRHKELISRGGEKLSPIEVERVLLRHPAVAEAAVFAVPHPRLGEDVAAAVVLNASQITSPPALQTYLRGYLAPFKVPRLIAIVRELPKDVTGKVRRRELSAMLADDAMKASGMTLAEPSCPLTADLMLLWCGLLQRDSVGLDEDFFVMGGDSLLAVQMRLAAEKMTGTVLPDALPFEAPTVRRFAQAIAECNGIPPSPLSELSQGERPFFFFHGDFISGGHYARRLAAMLRSSAGVISVAPHGLDREAIPTSVEDMARTRLPLILSAQPEGPYRLGGHCNGGAVALEVARLLQAGGHQIELLALINPPMVNASATMRLFHRVLTGALGVMPDAGQRATVRANVMELVWRVYEKIDRIVQTSPERRRAKIAINLKRFNDLIRQSTIGRVLPFRNSAGKQPAPIDPELEAELSRRRRHYFRTLAVYFPQPTRLPLVYYSTDHNARYLKRICPQLEIVAIPSDHFGLVTTHLHLIANDLRQRLGDSPTGQWTEAALVSNVAKQTPVHEHRSLEVFAK